MFNLKVDDKVYVVDFYHSPQKLRSNQKKKQTICFIRVRSEEDPKQLTDVSSGWCMVHRLDQKKYDNKTIRRLGLKKSLGRALINGSFSRPIRMQFFERLYEILNTPTVERRKKEAEAATEAVSTVA